MELVEAKDPCIDCGAKFMRIKQRGRPPVRCNDCFDKINKAKVTKATQVAANRTKEPKNHGNRPPQLQVDLKLWEGGDVIPTDREFRPKIGSREAQCIRCNRMFTSDGLAEEHKYYAQPTTPTCKPPGSLGMIAIEKRGFPVWTRMED